ncbi:MAG: LPS assembly lipoprotein LptE [Proteobacteria bacterium]|nr:LPS assembly lipoprotein LptE [Pseudomonadota bacterium]
MLLFEYLSRRYFAQALIAAVLVGGLSGCGFQAMYGSRVGPARNAAANTGDVVSDMAYVDVAPIADRVGQLVRNRLLDLLHPDGMADVPVFRLTAVLSEAREGLAIQQDDSTTRYNLRLTAKFRLIDSRDGAELLNLTTRAIAAYNVVQSDYANLISEKDARKRAALSVAEGIQDRIAVYFSRRRE